jgi:hypothetical protein
MEENSGAAHDVSTGIAVVTAQPGQVSRNAEDANEFTASVPGNGGMCSCHVVVLPSISEQVAKAIALSLVAVTEKQKRRR